MFRYISFLHQTELTFRTCIYVCDACASCNVRYKTTKNVAFIRCVGPKRYGRKNGGIYRDASRFSSLLRRIIRDFNKLLFFFAFVGFISDGKSNDEPNDRIICGDRSFESINSVPVFSTRRLVIKNKYKSTEHCTTTDAREKYSIEFTGLYENVFLTCMLHGLSMMYKNRKSK